MIQGENKIKILYVIDKLGSGGKERRLVQLLKGLQGRDIVTRVVLLTDVIHYREIHELDTEITILRRKIKKDPLIFFKLYRMCRKWKPDIIHSWGSMPSIYSAPVSWLLGIKMINAAIANAPLKLEKKLALRAFLTFPFSDVIQSNSYAGIKSYNVPKDKAHVVHNGFDFERTENLKEPDEVKEELNIDTRYVAGMVSVFRPHKDYRTFIEAARAILQKRDDITFLCVGDGADFRRTVRLAEGNERIIFTGEISDIESMVNIFDIGVLLTDLKRHGEGISNSIMEYMALGKPVIATDGGGTPELVINGETGYLIPDGATETAVEKIEYLLDNRDERVRMGEAGKEKVRDEFSLEKMVEEHLNLYRSLL